MFKLTIATFVFVVVVAAVKADDGYQCTRSGAELNLPSYQALCGLASGQSEFLGSVCFGIGTSTQVQVNIERVDKKTEVLPTPMQLLYYDDQMDSFDAIHREVKGYAKSCDQRADASKKICFKDGSCQHGLTVRNLPYKSSINITESIRHEWYFVLSDCVASIASSGLDYTISATSGYVGCEDVFTLTTSNAGYAAAIVMLTLICVALVIASCYFYRRTKIPELLTLDDTGYNEL